MKKNLIFLFPILFLPLFYFLFISDNSKTTKNNKINSIDEINMENDLEILNFTNNLDYYNFPKDNEVVKRIIGFLTPFEVSYLIDLAEKNFDNFKKSTIINKNNGNLEIDKSRTSKSFFIDKSNNEIIKNIENKASKLSNIPAENIEGIQIVRYGPGDLYESHFDSFEDNYLGHNGNGQRVVTFFVYLNNNFKGGTTFFPNLGKHFKGNPGDAFFWINTINGNRDFRTLHSGTKILNGKKYGLNIWIRDKKFIQ